LSNTRSTLIQAASDEEGVVDWCVSFNIVTSSIARNPKRRYLSNSEPIFEVFRPAGAIHCTDGGEIVNWLQKLQTEMEIFNWK